MSKRQQLVVSELWKAYPTAEGAKLEVLRGLSLTVAAGEMVAVMGASGTGKSTLLHLIGGLDGTDGGSISAGDFEVTRAGAESLSSYRRREVGFIFQFHHLLSDLTTVENVMLPLLINRTPRGEARQKALASLAEIDLEARAHQAVARLSGGEQQRVAVARALVTRPRLVLADEPTGNLDAALGQEIGSLVLRYCREHGAAVLVATHNERLASLCDRVLHLREGKLLA